MLEPREGDIPAVLLVLVVFPLVIYILLGIWNESAKKKERISLLAKMASEEALRVEAMGNVSIEPSGFPVDSFHECARCSSPATTRCSRCKAVRYCSGRCQIIHWRHGHSQECQKLETTCSLSSPNSIRTKEFAYERVIQNKRFNPSFIRNSTKQPIHVNTSSYKQYQPPIVTDSTPVDTFQVSMLEKEHLVSNREAEAGLYGSFEDINRDWVTDPALYSAMHLEESATQHKLGNDDCDLCPEEPSKRKFSPCVVLRGRNTPVRSIHENHTFRGNSGGAFVTSSNSGKSGEQYLDQSEKKTCKIGMGFTSKRSNLSREISSLDCGKVDLDTFPVKTFIMESMQSKNKVMQSRESQISLSPSSVLKASKEYLLSASKKKGNTLGESKISQEKVSTSIPAQGVNGVCDREDMNMTGLRKFSKFARQENTALASDGRKKLKVLFPYEEFVRFCHYEVWDLSPRGLVNCGNR
ncbi:hypothetical protein GIB67_031674 [Kingdonia uniflora]|uniref:MYND-type domain-containing protein n=1 Tax=Kingdonia uniflora TaxID=39325 RepID=A0A7J7NK51_9MAGN|nr:hypothetical protein GIB67_031674 [Kingdonia uniflora]